MPKFNSFVKQVEINSGGGIRITVLKQTIFDDGAVHDHPHQITIDTLATDEEIDAIVAANNQHLNSMGYPSIDPIELNFPLTMRAHAHNHPVVAERRAIEGDLRRAKRAEEEAEAKARENAEKKAQKEAEEAFAAAEAAAAESLQSKIDAAVADAVKKAAAKK